MPTDFKTSGLHQVNSQVLYSINTRSSNTVNMQFYVQVSTFRSIANNI